MDNIQTVERMQDYIREHFAEDEFCVEEVCAAVGYSRRHGDRLFKQYLGMTMSEYINAVCVSKSAEDLRNTKSSVLELAYQSHFESPEGFSRSFNKRFHITPMEYRKKQVAIPMFVQYPISHYYALLSHKEETILSENVMLCMVMEKERPKRKLIFLPSKKATDYLSFCEEVGCEWEGLLNSIPEKFDSAASVELPSFLVKEGYSKLAAGVEVPLDYDKPVPEGYQVVELEPCIMLYFQTESYENPADFGRAIGSAYAALEKYKPENFGNAFAYEKAPCFNFGADPATGGRIAVPVVKM